MFKNTKKNLLRKSYKLVYKSSLKIIKTLNILLK